MDLEKVRQTLKLTRSAVCEQMKDRQLIDHVKPSRLYEWEKGARPIPDWVKAFYRDLLLAKWEEERAQVTGRASKLAVDVYYAEIISPTLAMLTNTECDVILSDRYAYTRDDILKMFEDIRMEMMARFKNGADI